jgi:putative transposase
MYVIQSFGLSQRRASGLIGLNRNTLRHEPKEDKDGDLRNRMKELAEQRRRFGCRRLHTMLKREELVINHKRTERIYREEKLALRIRRRKKLASQGRIEIARAERPNELWGMDFLYDVLHSAQQQKSDEKQRVPGISTSSRFLV